jgi:putative membrane protein insertion efficiency factor
LETSRHISNGLERGPGPLSLIFIGVIQIYRFTLSPVLSLFSQCRYYPSCSHYAMDAIRYYGPWRGGYRAVKRILRCNPWFPGGYDPATPERNEED